MIRTELFITIVTKDPSFDVQWSHLLWVIFLALVDLGLLVNFLVACHEQLRELLKEGVVALVVREKRWWTKSLSSSKRANQNIFIRLVGCSIRKLTMMSSHNPNMKQLMRKGFGRCANLLESRLDFFWYSTTGPFCQSFETPPQWSPNSSHPMHQVNCPQVNSPHVFSIPWYHSMRSQLR